MRQALPGGELLVDTARVATAVGMEVDMAFVRQHIRPFLGRSSRKAKGSWLMIYERCAAIGNPFHTLSTSVLLAHCFQGQGLMGAGWSISTIQQRFVREDAEAGALRPHGWEGVEVPDILEIVTFGIGHPVLPGAEVEEVAAVQAVLHGEVGASSPALELVASGMAVKWQLPCQARGGRVLHLTDSQACLSVLPKGRTGSSRLRSGLQRISARCIGGGLVMTFAFVSSKANPSDAPSRRA